MKLTAAVCVLLLLTGPEASQLDRVYMDESHCLVGPEIRNDNDNRISCYCRDALVDARYVYRTYLVTEKDRNLSGPYLSLSAHAAQMCSESSDPPAPVYQDVSKIAEEEAWQWNGPTVTRTYPPDSSIAELRPDTKGLRHVKYLVQVTYRDSQGRITNVENYTAEDLFPPSWKPSAFVKVPGKQPTH